MTTAATRYAAELRNHLRHLEEALAMTEEDRKIHYGTDGVRIIAKYARIAADSLILEIEQLRRWNEYAARLASDSQVNKDEIVSVGATPPGGDVDETWLVP